MRGASTAVLIALCAIFTLVGACGPSAEEEAATERQERWNELQQTEAELAQKRERLHELEARLEAREEQAAETESADDDEGTATGAEEAGERSAAELEQQINSLRSEIDELAETFQADLVAFINSFETLQGEEMPELQKRAIRMKTEEDMRLAREWIDKGGDYRRAIEIYEAQIQYDPDYQALQEALDEAREMRYMTEERFAQVEEGMTEEKVRELLGPVNIRNIRTYEEEGKKAWFYVKDPETGAPPAGVWFEREDGTWTVYRVEFEIETEPS